MFSSSLFRCWRWAGTGPCFGWRETSWEPWIFWAFPPRRFPCSDWPNLQNRGLSLVERSQRGLFCTTSPATYRLLLFEPIGSVCLWELSSGGGCTLGLAFFGLFERRCLLVSYQRASWQQEQCPFSRPDPVKIDTNMEIVNSMRDAEWLERCPALLPLIIWMCKFVCQLRMDFLSKKIHILHNHTLVYVHFFCLWNLFLIMFQY